MPAELPAVLLAELRQEQQRLQDALNDCHKGTQCGFDMTAHEATIRALQERINATLLNFSPGKKKPT